MKFKERLQGLSTVRGANEITQTTLTSIPFVAAGLIAAALCSLYTVIFKAAEGLAFQTLEHHKWQFFFITPLTFVVSAWLIQRISPASSGSGIPQVVAVLQTDQSNQIGGGGELQLRRREEMSRRFLGWSVLPVKILGSSLAVMGGAAVGREGPSIQVSAVVFRAVRELWQKYAGRELSFYNMIVAGGAGGIAAAFNTPLGGVIFAVEELAKDHVASFRLGLLEAVLAAGFMAQLINGPYLYLGFPTLPNVNFHALLLVLLVSFVCGVGGAFFGVCFTRITRWRRLLSSKNIYITAAVSGLVAATIIYLVGAPSIGSGRELMRTILFEKPDINYFSPFARFLSPLVTACSGTAGGLFAPALSAGAAIGQVIGSLVDPDSGNLAPICGMIAFLTGVTRTPVTAFVLILEMTDRHSAIFAMMLAALFGMISARAVDAKSFYEHMADTFVADALARESAAKAPAAEPVTN